MRRIVLVVTLAFTMFGCGDDKPPEGVTEVRCAELPPVSSGTCEVTAGGDAKLLKGVVLTPTTVYRGGQVAVDATGQITCVGCDCAAGGETVISCPDGAISPGLINTHDHITYTQNPPYTDAGIRYEHRHQWRIGQDGKPRIPYEDDATADQIRWGELRFVMGGATSIVGSGGQAGLLRNLDRANLMEGLSQKPVKFDTFPLDDPKGTRRASDCNYGRDATTAADLASLDAYEPHTSEGIDGTARNEFLCQSSATFDTMAPGVSNNLLLGKTAMIHAIGLLPSDLGAMAEAGTGLIWSPRSNITLYGDTARVTVAAKLGVEIALGTDWMPSGSMNLLRELRCADDLNRTYYGGYFTDVALWQMVTINAAAVTATDDAIGLLAPGRVADLAIFNAHGGKTFRAVIDAEPADVALVIRGGKVLYGDDGAVAALGPPGGSTCDVVDVCGTSKRVCTMDEVGKTYAALQAAAGATIYPAFACGPPEHEPSCTPARTESVAGSSIYTGVPSDGDGDGDGIADGDDACPTVFDPIRPVDDAAQGDADGDGTGDACDPCPLDANTTKCTVVDPNDRDHDGVVNASDNCPDAANPDQADADADAKGDACDACPGDANPGAAGCPTTIYKVKTGTTPVGTPVRISDALVTAKGSNGFFVQIKEGDAGYAGADYSGLMVFTGANTPTLMNATVGARVTIDGQITNFQGQLELDGVSAVTVTAPGPEAPPAPIAATYAEIKTGGPRAAALEGVVVALGEAAVTAVDTMFGEFTLTAAGDTLVVDDFVFAPSPAPQVGQGFVAVTGVLAMRQMASKLEPRGAADLTAGPPGLAALTPPRSFARVGTTATTFPSPLTVSLTGPAQGDTVVTLTSGNAALAVGNVTVKNGDTTAVVPVTAVTQNADVTVTATLGAVSRTAHVRVLGPAEVPSTVTLSPSDAAVAPGGTVVFTVTLDLPATAGGREVGLAVNPATAGTLPATVTVAANQVSATFNYVDVATTGTATVTATLGASSSSATVTVSTGANHLVINEVDYDNVGPDTAEFIEIYNPSGAAVSLAGKQLVLVNGSGSAIYDTIDLASVGSLPANHYLVIAGANVTVTAPSIKLDPGWAADKIQNGPPDGVVLIDSTTHEVIDALSYEGGITTVMLPGFPAPVSLVEGTVLPTATADSNMAAGALCRSPNGQDTDSAAADWKVCTAVTAGLSNP